MGTTTFPIEVEMWHHVRRAFRCNVELRGKAARLFVVALTSWGCIGLSGCVVSRSGPLLSEVQASDAASNVVLVPVTRDIAAATREPDQDRFPAPLHSSSLDYEKLAPGDGVEIVIWGRDGMGVFPASAEGRTSLGEVVVDNSGTIYVPHVGKVKAAQLSTLELREAILRRISRVTVGVDVSVHRTDRKGQMVSIQGDLAKPGVYPIGLGMKRLSDLLSVAAPNQNNPEELEITVRRRAISGSVRLTDIYRQATEDIYLQAGDTVIIRNLVRRIVVLGAVGSQANLKLTKRNYSVLEALGDARGLNDALANPKAVFLLRSSTNSGGENIALPPTLYQFDFTRPEQLILAGDFTVRAGDAIYVSDAPFTQLQKVLSAFSATLGTARALSSMPQ